MTKGAVASLTRGLARPMTSLGRYGQTSDIASVVSYLAGPEASFVTGANWNADGGFTGLTLTS